MELTEQVSIALDNAEYSLRDALAFAAKTENPVININIAHIISAVQNVKNYYNKNTDPSEEFFRRIFPDAFR